MYPKVRSSKCVFETQKNLHCGSERLHDENILQAHTRDSSGLSCATVSFRGRAAESTRRRACAYCAHRPPSRRTAGVGSFCNFSRDFNGYQPGNARRKRRSAGGCLREFSNAQLKKDMQEMRAEITELKGELKSRNDADAVSSEAIKAYEQDVAALKTAVHPVASSPSMQAAAAPAAPAPPEITAETTTK